MNIYRMHVFPMSDFGLTEPPFVEKYAKVKEKERTYNFYTGNFLERLFDFKIRTMIRNPTVQLNMNARKLVITAKFKASSRELSVDEVILKLTGWRGSHVIELEHAGKTLEEIECLVGAKLLCKLVNEMK